MTRSIRVNDTHLGAVARFVGNKPGQRWVAWSVHRKSAAEENRACFPTMHAAIDWLVEEHDRNVPLQLEAM